MYSNRIIVQKKASQKMSKGKSKLSKLIAPESGSDSESEHELSHYIEDRVKLMKEILKIIKPKKIKSMAPECMRNMDMQEINSMLLEELLGISNKRLKYIFEGKTLEEESSTDEDQPEDVISLDDISDDEFIVISDDETSKPRHKHKKRKIKQELTEKGKKVKKEKPDKNKVKEIEKVKDKLSRGEKANTKEKDTIGEENLMSVLELLELQARARAIKSQLELESKKKEEDQQRLMEESKSKNNNDQQEDDDEIIMQIPKEVHIVITSSESENDDGQDDSSKHHIIQSNSSILSKDLTEAESSIQIDEQLPQIKAVGQEAHTSGKDEALTNNDSVTNAESLKQTGDEGNITQNISSIANKADSDSSSNDSLQVVQAREMRRHRDKKVHTSEENSAKPEEKSQDINSEQPQSPTSSSHSNLDEACKSSKIDTAIQEFMKTQPSSSDNNAELKRLEEKSKEQDEKKKQDKKKRLKNLKNKIESFKQEVAVESSTVNVLENIVIKPQTRNLDESDDLVINVDQDDVDCMICD